jgi:hypothetical protein
MEIDMSQTLTVEKPVVAPAANTTNTVAAPNKTKTITLCMIVKNESHVI